MDKLVKWLENLLRAQKKSRAWRTFVSCLAAIVVFTTTYSLILPAITVESSATDSVGGLVVQGADPGSTGTGAEASADVVTVEAENETPEDAAAEEAPAAYEESAPAEDSYSAADTSSASETAKPAESTPAVVPEVKVPANGEVQTIGDKRVMILTDEDFDLVVSGDLSVGVADGTVLSVRGIADEEVVIKRKEMRSLRGEVVIPGDED